MRAQSLAYSSDSHGNRTLTRPDPSGSCVSVTVPLTSPAHREPPAAGEPPVSPKSDRSCCPDTVIQVSYPRTASKTWREVVTVYRPSNGAPTAFSATAVPARTSGFPRITASSSANDPAIRSASAFAAWSTWACAPYAASVTTNRASPNGADTSAAVTPSSSVGDVPAGARPTSGCFARTSQPRTSTSETCSAADTPARQRSRLLPSSRTSGSRSARAEASGAPPASMRLRDVELPVPYVRLRARLLREAAHELPVGDVGLGDVFQYGPGDVDRARLEPGTLGDLAADVGEGHVLVAGHPPPPEQPVRLVEPPHDGERAGLVELHLQRGDDPSSSGFGSVPPPARASSRASVPIFSPACSSSTRSGSRNRSRNRSGSVRLSST